MIRLVNVSKSFTGKLVLQDLSLELGDAERLVVLGPSGSGKTTLLRIIAGLELPDLGEVYIGGKLASRAKWGLPPYARGVGFAFQSPTLWPHMTVLQNLTFGLDSAPQDEKRRVVNELAQAFGFADLLGRYPGQLSGGEARRVGLARALAPHPRLLLMDEPLTNLDEALKTRILQSALTFMEEFQPTLVFVTHDPVEAATLADGGAATLHLGK